MKLALLVNKYLVALCDTAAKFSIRFSPHCSITLGIFTSIAFEARTIKFEIIRHLSARNDAININARPEM